MLPGVLFSQSVTPLSLPVFSFLYFFLTFFFIPSLSFHHSPNSPLRSWPSLFRDYLLLTLLLFYFSLSCHFIHTLLHSFPDLFLSDSFSFLLFSIHHLTFPSCPFPSLHPFRIFLLSSQTFYFIPSLSFRPPVTPLSSLSP